MSEQVLIEINLMAIRARKATFNNFNSEEVSSEICSYNLNEV